MIKTSKSIDPDIHFRVLFSLEENPHITQRELARKLGISLGGVNYCLKALINIGHIKAGNFSKNPNKDLTKISEPEYQQTIFDEVYYPLSYIDDETDISTAPEPLELFLGFRADDEGAIRSILQLYKKEDVSLTIDSTSVVENAIEKVVVLSGVTVNAWSTVATFVVPS